MDGPPNLDRRIKRHLIGKPKHFFAITAPGLEGLCRSELSALGFTMAHETKTTGGISFQGRIHEGYTANLEARTANRVLMRIDEFEATNFRQLARKLTALPWELYLYKDAALDIRVTARRSRLYHTGAVAEQCREAISRRRDMAGTARETGTEVSPCAQQIFVRAHRDHFTLSMDSSGDILYKRGIKTQGGKAPMRETTAAAILAICGYGGDEPLLDPMCGSGTFALEGAMIANRIPAGYFRNFAFMDWPCFRPARWNHIRQQAKTKIIERTEPIIFAADIDRGSRNALSTVIADHHLSGTISVVGKDFFDLLPTDCEEKKTKRRTGLVTINPPYGRRLESPTQSEKLFLEICRKLKTDFRGWKIALVTPMKRLIPQIPFRVKTRNLFHGGLKLILLTGRVP
jgi:putative N6-adenine-specific DNA methylase